MCIFVRIFDYQIKYTFMVPEINIKEYNYNLPDERIAKYPLPIRDSSKLLIYKEEQIRESIFNNISSELPENAIMVFNDTKVVPARLHFQKPSGAHIEIFCLEPVMPSEYNLIFSEKKSCRWKCIVGNLKKWKENTLVLYNPSQDEAITSLGLTASLIEKQGATSIIEFNWIDNSEFSRVLEISGSIPIPPYLKRDTEDLDLERYQTLYAKYRGSVAAPTAGLHFTETVLDSISDKGIDREEVCLHVGAGTFVPVKSEFISGHNMHREPFIVKLKFLEKLRNRKGKIVAVGTTSSRTLESLYFLGVKCIEDGRPSDIEQWLPYKKEYNYTLNDSLDALIKYLNDNNLDEIKSSTQIIIVPGYKFRIIDILITNFHQPQSTLLLLISAFLGGNWKTVYDYALKNNFRFLSYGDSSLLFRA